MVTSMQAGQVSDGSITWVKYRSVKAATLIPIVGDVIYVCAMCCLTKAVSKARAALPSEASVDQTNACNEFVISTLIIQQSYVTLSLFRSILALAGVATLTVLGIIFPPIWGIALGGIYAAAVLMHFCTRKVVIAKREEIEVVAAQNQRGEVGANDQVLLTTSQQVQQRIQRVPVPGSSSTSS